MAESRSTLVLTASVSLASFHSPHSSLQKKVLSYKTSLTKLSFLGTASSVSCRCPVLLTYVPSAHNEYSWHFCLKKSYWCLIKWLTTEWINETQSFPGSSPWDGEERCSYRSIKIQCVIIKADNLYRQEFWIGVWIQRPPRVYVGWVGFKGSTSDVQIPHWLKNGCDGVSPSPFSTPDSPG